jgi:uncharacterized membrane protein
MRRVGRRRAVFLFVTIILACAASPAMAALKLCNRTSYVLYASTGQRTNSTITTRGWTRIAPGACEAAIQGALSAAAYYVYARTSQAHRGPARAWGGTSQLCVKETDYAIETPAGASNCRSDDAFLAPFAPVATKGEANWTMTFTQHPPLGSADAARRAGLARLLGDIGYRIGANGVEGVPAALEKFRTRMKLTKDAPSADLFDALETEALKVAAPAGYSICNDTDAPVWAALGERRGKVWSSRGWWKIVPGACARVIATALDTDKVYLLVERKDGKRLVSGKEAFCITNIQFDVEGRMKCAARGLKPAGFATTVTKGLTGFAAHVSEDGLLPPPRFAD